MTGTSTVFHVAGAQARDDDHDRHRRPQPGCPAGRSRSQRSSLARAGAGLPTGDVVFDADGQDFPSRSTMSTASTATFTDSFNVLGSHTVSASYAGDAAYLGSTSAGLTETIQGTAVTPAAPNYHLTFTVSNANDAGAGSLRQAITDSERNPGTAAAPNHIIFAIPETDPGKDPTTGTFVITPASALPAIDSPTVLDGYTQAGASANTDPIDLADNAVIRIELDGSLIPEADGLDLHASNGAVLGLSIVNFAGEVTYTAGTPVILGGAGIRIYGSRTSWREIISASLPTV